MLFNLSYVVTPKIFWCILIIPFLKNSNSNSLQSKINTQKNYFLLQMQLMGRLILLFCCLNLGWVQETKPLTSSSISSLLQYFVFMDTIEGNPTSQQ